MSMNPNEPGIFQFSILYLIFQVGLSTYFRLLTKGEEHEISVKSYLIMLIPGIGILYAVYSVLIMALSKD